jgi:hypothetical protein
MWVKCLLDRFTFLVGDCDGELFFEPCGDASPSRVMGKYAVRVRRARLPGLH